MYRYHYCTVLSDKCNLPAMYIFPLQTATPAPDRCFFMLGANNHTSLIVSYRSTMLYVVIRSSPPRFKQPFHEKM